MCDQDHFEDDRKQAEALGLVTRKQFGKILGAGMAMMLPQVANAAAVGRVGPGLVSTTRSSVPPSRPAAAATSRVAASPPIRRR